MANISHFTQTVNGVSTTYDIHDAGAVQKSEVGDIITHNASEFAQVGHTHSMSDIADVPSVLPIGSYIQFAGSQAPAGFLVCNGGAISRTTYSALFAVIGTKYGEGDGSTTFNLPNLTDRFLQGNTTVGAVRNAGLPNITGSIYIGHTDRAPSSYTNGCITVASSTQEGFSRTAATISATGLGIYASNSNSIYGSSSTVQPPALTCLICIKY